jgi:DNA end-binding protein Ku
MYSFRVGSRTRLRLGRASDPIAYCSGSPSAEQKADGQRPPLQAVWDRSANARYLSEKALTTKGRAIDPNGQTRGHPCTRGGSVNRRYLLEFEAADDIINLKTRICPAKCEITFVMRAIWKGNISFGLVNIPIALYPATKREELKFRLLRAKDLSPVSYKRVAEKDGKEVPWDEIVKGYEYEKGKYIVLKDEDFQRVDLEATQTVDIQDFVEVDEIDPIFFYKPYYLEPQKGGDKAYVLLRDSLSETKKVGIAKVVIKTRQYLAGVKPEGDVLLLELMHFAEELADPKQLHVPKKLEAGKRELDMAKALVGSMSAKWDPEKYHDDYREALMEVIEEKVEAGGKEIEEKPKKAPKPTKVIDLVSVLQRSLEQSGAAKKSAKSKRAARSNHRQKKAA